MTASRVAHQAPRLVAAPSTARRLAHLLSGLALALDVLAVLLLVPQAGTGGFERLDGSTLGGYVLGATFPVVGWLIATRRPGNAIGWVFIAIGLSQALDTFAGQYGVVGLVTTPGSLPAADLLAWVAVWAWAPGFTLLLTYSVLLFPDGHLPSPRWRPVAWLAGLSLVLLVVPVAILAWGSPGRDLVGTGPVESTDAMVTMILGLQFVGLILLMISGLGSIAGLVVRFRRSTGAERAQLKWFVAAGAIEVVSLSASAFVTLPGLLLNALLTVTVAPLLPIAATVAILRYHLYDIDRIVSRTVAWGAVTLVLVLVFAGAVVGLDDLLADVTQGQTLAVAASTLLAFALFQPLRARVQDAVDWRFDRARYDGQRIVDAFADGLRGQVDLAQINDGVLAAVAGTVRPRTGAVWLRERRR